jgi:hypothetical protein
MLGTVTDLSKLMSLQKGGEGTGHKWLKFVILATWEANTAAGRAESLQDLHHNQ